MTIATDLRTARDSAGPTDADPRIGWAWMEAEYRASAARAFHGPNGALTFSDEGLAALERAVEALLRDQRVKAVWRIEDLWSIVLSLLAASSTDIELDLDSAVDKILKPKPVRVVAALANVRWTSGPVLLGEVALAALGDQASADELAALLGLDETSSESLRDHTRQLAREFGSYVAATSTSPRQGELAHQDFERVVEDLVGLVLMLSTRLDENGVYSLRGATNRPGVRGIALDRGALGELLSEKGAGELGARVLTITGWGASNNFRWHSADPVPLDVLLDEDLRPRINDLLTAEDVIAQRLRVAARWYARAFWASAHDDAALAVSVALDSLLTGKDALPGAVSKGRFALLERNASERAAKLARYEDVYQVRSAIAHGGDAARRLAAIGGARSMLTDARWVAGQLLELRELVRPRTDAEFRDAWAGIQWGTTDWVLRPPPKRGPSD